MPDVNHFTGLPVPLDGEAADGPEAFSLFRDALGGHTVLYAQSVAERDSLYVDAPVGTLCSCTTADLVWRKTATGWKVLYYDSGQVSLAGSLAWSADWEDRGSLYQIRNGLCFLDVRGTYRGDPIVADSSGNIDDSTIATVPAAIKPLWSGTHVTGYALFGSFGVYLELNNSGSALFLRTGAPGATYGTGVALNWTATYVVADPA